MLYATKYKNLKKKKGSQIKKTKLILDFNAI